MFLPPFCHLLLSLSHLQGILDFIFCFGFPKHWFSFSWYSRNYLIHVAWLTREGREITLPLRTINQPRAGEKWEEQVTEAMTGGRCFPQGFLGVVTWSFLWPNKPQKAGGQQQDWRKGPGLQDTVGEGGYLVRKSFFSSTSVWVFSFFLSSFVHGLRALASLGLHNFFCEFFFKSHIQKMSNWLHAFAKNNQQK